MVFFSVRPFSVGMLTVFRHCFEALVLLCCISLSVYAQSDDVPWVRLYNLSGKSLLSVRGDTMFPVSDHLLAFRYKGKYGLITHDQEVKLPPVWEAVKPIMPGHYLLEVAGRLHHITISQLEKGLIMDWGRPYDKYLFLSGMHLLRHADNFLNMESCWDILDEQGVMLGQACGQPQKVSSNFIQFTEPNGGGTLFHKNKARVAYFSKGKVQAALPPTFIISLNNKKQELWHGFEPPRNISNTQWDSISFLSSRYVLANDSLHYCVLNTQGAELFCADSIWRLNNGFLGYKLQRTFGVVDSMLKPLNTGKLKIERPPRPTGIGHILVKNATSTFLLNAEKRKHWRIKSVIDWIGELHSGMAPFLASKRYGFIDEEGEIRVSARYDSVRHFKGQLAAVLLNGKWGFINKDEDIIVQPVYEKVSDFEKGVSIAVKEGMFGMINTKGEVLQPFIYDAILPIGDACFLVEKNQRKGCVNLQGEIIIPVKYQQITALKENKYVVRREGKAGVLDTANNELLPLEYAILDYYPDRGFFIKVTPVN
jgi:hypothetical protein